MFMQFKNPNIWTLGNKVDKFVCKITLFLTHSCTDEGSNGKKVTPNVYDINDLCMTCISKLPSCKQYRRTCSQSALCSSHPQIDFETEGRLYRNKIIRLTRPDWLYVKPFSLTVCIAQCLVTVLRIRDVYPIPDAIFPIPDPGLTRSRLPDPDPHQRI